MGIARHNGALVVGDMVRSGQTVQFHVRDAATATEDLELLLAPHERESPAPAGGLLFSCNGRGTRMFPEPHHDARAIRRHLTDLPLAGFFAAGEIGHASIDYRGKTGPYGNFGGLEEYVGNQQIAERAAEAYRAAGIPRTKEQCTPRELDIAAQSGDGIAKSVWEAVGDEVGAALAPQERTADPLARRLIALAALDAREDRTIVTRMLEEFEEGRLAGHPYLQQVLKTAGLSAKLLEVGVKVASTMVELFADLPPDHEYFRQFSFINPDDLPDYRALINRADPTRLDALGEADRQRLLALAFKLSPARHRLGLLEAPLQARLVEARKRFHARLPKALAGSVAFFDL